MGFAFGRALMFPMTLVLVGLVIGNGLVGCAPARKADVKPDYKGIETRLLEGDLVTFLVKTQGGTRADVFDYAECAAVQYTLIRGYGFARHVRTTVEKENGFWIGDAVYVVSAALPEGSIKLDAEVVDAACAENGIPRV